MQIFDKNMMFSDKEIGTGRLALSRVYQAGTMEERVQLVTAKGKAAGELQLVLTFKPY